MSSQMTDNTPTTKKDYRLEKFETLETIIKRQIGAIHNLAAKAKKNDDIPKAKEYLRLKKSNATRS